MIPTSRIWVLEDDPDCVFVYEELLGDKYELAVFRSLSQLSNALEGISSQASTSPDLLISDLRVEDGDFLSFLAKEDMFKVLRCPFIVVSSYDDLDLLNACFKEGALDFLTKPFSKNALLAKVDRFLGFNASSMAVRTSGVTLDAVGHGLLKDGEIVAHLTAKELQIFSILYNSPGMRATRRELQTAVWGSVNVTSKTLDVHLFNLRKKLSNAGLELRNLAHETYGLSGNGVDPVLSVDSPVGSGADGRISQPKGQGESDV